MPLDNPAILVQAAWTAPTLLNSWANYGSPWNPSGYWKDSLGVVHLRGLVSTGATGSIIFVLPVGYRPANQEAIATIAFGLSMGYTFGRVDVWTNGSVQCQTGVTTGANAAFFLDGLTFRAA